MTGYRTSCIEAMPPSVRTTLVTGNGAPADRQRGRLAHPQGLAQDVRDGCARQLAPQGLLNAAVDVAQRGPDASADWTFQIGLGAMHAEERLLLDGVVHVEQGDLLRRAGQTPARP